MKVEVRAYAKINLVLDVLKKRNDGYHEVAMVMQAIDLADTITITASETNTITSNRKEVPSDDSNLVMKAAKLLQKEFSQLPQVHIHIDKQIPVAAGLAGGSTDGAATIIGMNQLFGLGLSEQEMMDLAAQLGSDLPFCIGGPTALATGRGEVITELPQCPKLWMVLVKPYFGVKTPMVYQHLDLATVAQHPDVDRYVQYLADGDQEAVLANIGNVLEHSTFKLYTQVEELKQKLIGMGANHVLMSGSGPTIFCLFGTEKEALDFYQHVPKDEHFVCLTSTVDEARMKERVKIYD